jgi:pimeloyl-ACP methyl ester carboxylesterase
MSTPPLVETSRSPVDAAPAVPACQPPAVIRKEVEQYDQAATVGRWQGPRYRMTYRLLGEGPPLLWVPGIASTYRTYALVLNRLAERFRTIQYEYPGDDPEDGARLGRISHDHLVDDLFGLIEHLKLGRIFLVGLSFGGTVVLETLLREPRRFPRSVVQGTFARRRFTPAEHAALFLGRRIPGSVSRLPLRERILAYNSRLDFPRPIEDRWGFYVEQNGLTPIRALAHRTSLVARLDLRQRLPRVQSDLLLVQGREDRIVPYRYFEELKALLGRSESVVMPTVGHIPHLTHGESLARLIRDWLLPCNPEGCSREAAGEASRGGTGPPCPEVGIGDPAARTDEPGPRVAAGGDP